MVVSQKVLATRPGHSRNRLSHGGNTRPRPRPNNRLPTCRPNQTRPSRHSLPRHPHRGHPRYRRVRHRRRNPPHHQNLGSNSNHPLLRHSNNSRHLPRPSSNSRLSPASLVGVQASQTSPGGNQNRIGAAPTRIGVHPRTREHHRRTPGIRSHRAKRPHHRLIWKRHHQPRRNKRSNRPPNSPRRHLRLPNPNLPNLRSQLSRIRSQPTGMQDSSPVMLRKTSPLRRHLQNQKPNCAKSSSAASVTSSPQRPVGRNHNKKPPSPRGRALPKWSPNMAASNRPNKTPSLPHMKTNQVSTMTRMTMPRMMMKSLKNLA